jgi:tetratricopeptide (TPR) repeat protein
VGDLNAAAGHFIDALEISTHHAEAMSGLVRIYTEMSSYEDLIEILRYELEGPVDNDRRVEIHMRLAELLEMGLGDLDGAVTSLESILDLRPLHREAFDDLERILTTRFDWKMLCRVLERRADALEDPAARVEIWVRMAQIAEDYLDQPEEAIRFWNAVLDVRPESHDALESLTRLLEAMEEFPRLAEVLARRIELGATADRVAMAVQLAGIYSDPLDDADKALTWWRRVTGFEPSHLEAHRKIVVLLRATGDDPGLLEASRALSELVDSDERLTLLMSVADLLLTLDRREECIAQWRGILELELYHERALDELERFYTEDENWSELLEIYRTRFDLIGDEKAESAVEWESSKLRMRIGRVCMRMGDREGAEEAWMDLFEIVPEHDEVFGLLEDLLGTGETPDRLLALYDLRLDCMEPGQARLELVRAAAEVAVAAGGSKAYDILIDELPAAWEDETFFDCLLRTARDQKMSWHLADQVVSIQSRGGTIPTDDLRRLLHMVLATQTESKHSRMPLMRQLGESCDEAGEDQLALEFYQAVLEGDRSDAKVARLVREKLEATQAEPELMEHLEWMVANLRMRLADKEEINATLHRFYTQTDQPVAAAIALERNSQLGRGSLYLLLVLGAVLTLLTLVFFAVITLL